MSAISIVRYVSYTGQLVMVLFKCQDCGCNQVYRHKRDYKLTFFEGHYHCLSCKKEVGYASDDFYNHHVEKILYGYKPYAEPRTGIFNTETNEYSLKGGWIQQEEEIKIIGETDDCYVYDLRKSEHGEWYGDKVLTHKYTLPVGVHKSRFVKWTAGQLTLAI